MTSTSGMPRLLVIMGSGETSPTMVKTHRELLDRLGPAPVPAVLLDTPFGFQMNADEIAGRAVQYFRESVGQEIGVASFRSAATADPVDVETLATKVREARYVFAGPGSPSYALRQWSGSPVPDALAEKLERGGCVTFASAAALTLGTATVPVYEVYKVGEDPRWLEGLDLLGATGLRAAVIPHYNNAEGGNHDTRFCYLGETRLQVLEDELASIDADAFVLGVDEHTGCIFDLDAGSVTVVGRGVVTVRSRGCSLELETGTETATVELRSIADRLRSGGAKPAAGGVMAGEPRESGDSHADATTATRAPAGQSGGQLVGVASSPLLEAVDAHEAAFADALERRDVRAAVSAILDLDSELTAWQADTLQSDEMDRARRSLRGMVVRLGEVAEVGAKDPVEVVAGFVEALLEVRTSARDAARWADADAVRDRLLALGVEVRDTPEGTVWTLQ